MPDAVVIPAWADLLDQMMVGAEGNTAPELLKQLALTGVYRRAATVTPRAKSMPELNPAPPEIWRACAKSDAENILAFERRPPLNLFSSLWLTILFHKQKRLPHTLLPQFFLLAKHNASLIPYLIRVIGERGRWMIGSDENYAYMRQPVLLEEDDETLLGKTLEDWEKDWRYVAWMNSLSNPAYVENMKQQFVNTYNQIMEGLAR